MSSDKMVSLMYPYSVADMDSVIYAADMVTHLPMKRLWFGQSIVIDPFSAISYLLGSGRQISYGLAVSLIPFHTPIDFALRICSLSQMGCGDSIVGVGVGEKYLTSSALGNSWRSPLTATSEFLIGVRTVLGRTLTHHNEDIMPSWAQFPRDPQYYNIPEIDFSAHDSGEIKIGVGTLSERMSFLGGVLGDALLPWMVSPDRLQERLTASADGAAASGRAKPYVAVGVPVVADSASWAVDAFNACAIHAGRDHYRRSLTRSGVQWDDERPYAVGRALVENGVVAILGNTLNAQLQHFHDAGADEVFLNPIGVMQREAGIKQGLAKVSQSLS